MLYPKVPPTFWSYLHAVRMLRRKALSPPLGLLTVAAMLPAKWNKRLVDVNVRPLTDEDLAWADYVFISGMTVQREDAKRLIAQCRAAGKTIVAGGPLFTGEYALFEEVEHFVLGEAEPVMASLIADMEKGVLKRAYRSREFPDLRDTPVPQWDLIDFKDYACMGLQFTRGCPYDCEFCNVTQLSGRAPRVKKASQIIAELDALRDLGCRGPLFFVDDNLIGNRPALKKELLPALIDWQERRGPVAFFTQASINLADDPELMDNMVRAGFDMVFVGIETPDPAALHECGKSQNMRRDLVQDVKRLQRAGLEVQAGFIVGFDTDTASTFQRQVDFIKASGIVTAMVGLLQAPPGTRLAQRLWSEGRLLGQSTGDNTDGTTNIVPKMGLEALRDGYQSLLRHLYSPRPYYQRIKTFLRDYHTPSRRAPLNMRSVMAFARSVYHLGIVGSERVEYWLLIVWTLLHRPSILPAAIRLAICGNHYRRIWQESFAPSPAA